jgi:hypothetical protein
MTAMVPTREAAQRISNATIAAADQGESVLGLMCECHFGEDFDVTDVDSVFRIMEHSQYDHVSPREMYRVSVHQITW